MTSSPTQEEFQQKIKKKEERTGKGNPRKAPNESQNRHTEDYALLKNLHRLVNRLLLCPDLPTALEEVLIAAMEITRADMGNIQLYDPSNNTLKIVAQHGFKQDYLEHFRTVGIDDNTACGRAMSSGERPVIEDVQTDALFGPHREIASSAGFRGVQSTPLMNRDGEMIGMLSTHYRHPYLPSEHDLRKLDLYARQAADFIERIRNAEALRESQNHYRLLFDSIEEGFCIIEVIFAENGKPVDYRFLEVNSSFERHTGLIDAQGKRISELAPVPEEHWFEIYGQVALTGRTVRFQYHAEQLNRWYDVYASRYGRPENHQVAVVFDDITARKQIEEDFRNEHQNFSN